MDGLTAVLFVAGLVLLVGGAEALVRGASALALTLGISPLVVGLTVVAFGTSAPEAAVSVASSAQGRGDLALGNVVGSNICNILLILGLSALFGALVVDRRLIRREVPLFIGLSVLTLLMALDGAVGRLDGLVLGAGAVAYTAWAVISSRRETAGAASAEGVDLAGPQAAGSTPRPAWVNVGLIVLGLAGLVLGSQWLVDGAVEVAQALGLSELVVGLTIVAAGTSLPELATSVIATMRGQRDLAVGNAVGSCLLNLLMVLSAAAVVAPGGIPAPDTTVFVDLPVMIAVAVACLPIFFTGYTIARWEGGLFVAAYVAYVAYLVLDATGHDAVDHFGLVTVAFALPLVAVTLGVVSARELRAHRRAGGRFSPGGR